MKRWGQIKGDVDYKAVAEQVYLATDAKVMKEMGLTPPATSYKSFAVMGKTFDPQSRTIISPASRSGRRREGDAQHSAVVPANAGTHTPRR